MKHEVANASGISSENFKTQFVTFYAKFVKQEFIKTASITRSDDFLSEDLDQ